MKQLGLMIDMDRCIGCKTCIVACRNHHGIVDHENCMPNEIPYYIRVEKKLEGTFPMVYESCWVVPCQHCAAPGCLSACPREAISKDPQTGVVRIDREKCDGCEYSADISAQNKNQPAPCQASCPAGLNVQGYVQLVKHGLYERAVKLILERVPLPGVLGRVCPHPCESNCRRGEVDDPISIRELKRVAADNVDFEKLPIPAIKDNGLKVAVIGSGPAGLTTAYDLRLKGCQVTIFEALDKLGGMLRVGIPDYRLPSEVLDREINYLLRHGIETRTGVCFGKDFTLEDLEKEGFCVVFFGFGLQAGIKMNVPGEDGQGVMDALGFLKAVNLGQRPEIGKKIAVVGGGNVAVDTARMARRLGCPEVTLVYRRGEEEMPAYPEEIKGAGEEGVKFRYLASPMEVVLEGEKVKGLKCLETKLGPPDASGRRSPIPVLGSEFVIDCDMVIPAIGQALDCEWAVGLPDLAISNTVFASRAMQTSIPYVFAAGDAVRGPATVIEAIADGHKAAEAIYSFLHAEPIEIEEAPAAEPLTWQAVPPGVCEKAARAEAGHMEPSERVECFLEECHGLTAEQAAEEAGRCLNCGACCMQSCPYDVIQFDAESGRSHKCNLCYDQIVFGEKPVCAEVCMTDAIIFGEVEMLKESSCDRGREVDLNLSSESVVYLKTAPKNSLALG